MHKTGIKTLTQANNELTLTGFQVGLFMAIINRLCSSAFRTSFFAPLLAALNKSRFSRSCPELSDARWLTLGVERVLESCSSGRNFLQKTASRTPEGTPERAHFFESLKSSRRLKLNSEINAALCDKGGSILPDRLAHFPELQGFDVYAADGHYHAAATHDARDVEGKKHATGHIYRRNLRSGTMDHSSDLCDIRSKKEHEMHALKRITIDSLRRGSPKGRKVILVYDRAVVDFRQWFKWKYGSGIYLITRSKENLVFDAVIPRPFDKESKRNAGVIEDALVQTSSGGELLRKISFEDVETGKIYVFLTNITDEKMSPGVIAELYRQRWAIEKSFDEFKNKLMEKKSWASSVTAKSQQAEFICMAWNLMLLAEHTLDQKEGIRNDPELKRRKQRLELAVEKAGKAGKMFPQLRLLSNRMTQLGVKLIGWVSAQLWLDASWGEACESLRLLYRSL
jgi:hypothetical protein